jgi:hypothetical protein
MYPRIPWCPLGTKIECYYTLSSRHFFSRLNVSETSSGRIFLQFSIWDSNKNFRQIWAYKIRIQWRTLLHEHLRTFRGVARVGRVVRPPRATESNGRQREWFKWKNYHCPQQIALCGHFLTCFCVVREELWCWWRVLLLLVCETLPWAVSNVQYQSDAGTKLYDMYSNFTDECAVDNQRSDSCSPSEKYIKISKWMVLWKRLGNLDTKKMFGKSRH